MVYIKLDIAGTVGFMLFIESKNDVFVPEDGRLAEVLLVLVDPVPDPKLDIIPWVVGIDTELPNMDELLVGVAVGVAVLLMLALPPGAVDGVAFEAAACCVPPGAAPDGGLPPEGGEPPAGISP